MLPSTELKKDKARSIATTALRRAITVVFSTSCFVLLLGSGLNHLGHKYTRVVSGHAQAFMGYSSSADIVLGELRVEPGTLLPLGSSSTQTVNIELLANSTVHIRRALANGSSSSSSSGGTDNGGANLLARTSTVAVGAGVEGIAAVCKRQVLAINVPNSNMCCDAHLRQSDWVCVAAFDRFNKVLSSSWAYVIPLVPWALSTACDTAASMAHARRLMLYLVLFLVRMLVLYKALGWVQSSLQAPPGSSCWYAPYTKHSLCLADQFDFSDHIVLYVVNYLAPAAIEVAYAHTALAATGGGTWLRYSPAVGAACILSLITLRGLLFTCMFFHSPLESAVGLAVATLGVLLPLYAFAETSSWHGACISVLAKA